MRRRRSSKNGQGSHPWKVLGTRRPQQGKRRPQASPSLGFRPEIPSTDVGQVPDSSMIPPSSLRVVLQKPCHRSIDAPAAHRSRKAASIPLPTRQRAEKPASLRRIHATLPDDEAVSGCHRRKSICRCRCRRCRQQQQGERPHHLGLRPLPWRAPGPGPGLETSTPTKNADADVLTMAAAGIAVTGMAAAAARPSGEDGR